MRGGGLVAGVLVAMIIAPALAAQAQQRDTPPSKPAAATGRIAGTVINAESGRPVRFASVTLIGSTGEFEQTTNDAGMFSFDHLESGAYTCQINKAGYLNTAYGQTRPGTDTPGKPILLREGEQLDRLVVPLSQGGSIGGVVRDERGDPAYHADVRVMRWVMRGGVRKLETVGSTRTDERGRYRVSLLPPRQYIVSATPEQAEAETSDPDAQARGFAAVYFPSTLSPQAASVVAIGLGDERTDIDLQLPLVQLGRIKGVVLTADGRPAREVNVSARDRDHPDFVQSARTEEDGRFTIDRLLPGPYAVRAAEGKFYGNVQFVLRDVKLSGGADGGAVRLRSQPKTVYAVVEASESARADNPDGKVSVGTASDEIAVASGATTELVLTLQPPRTVSGRLQFDGVSSRPPLQELQIVLTARTDVGEEIAAKVKDDGTFSATAVPPGRYSISLVGRTDEWQIGSAISGGVEALDYLLDVPGDRDIQDLTVTVRDRGAELMGTVLDGQSKPAAGRLVVIFAEDERLWAGSTGRVLSATLKADGTYEFTRLRPGAYRLAVAEDAEPDEWLDPAFLKKLLAASVPVRIVEGDKRVQDLRVR